jgi:hypothetical protein
LSDDGGLLALLLEKNPIMKAHTGTRNMIGGTDYHEDGRAAADYTWPDFLGGGEGAHQWVLKNEGRRSPFSSWMDLMPMVVLFDVALIFAEVQELGNGGLNPYFGSHLTDEITILVPAFVCWMNWFTFKCLNWATDTNLNYLDITTYKFNQFGSITVCNAKRGWCAPTRRKNRC